MITIEFYRFVPTLKTYKSYKGIKNIFTKILDHTIIETDNQLDFSKAKKLVHSWLKNHYGCCTIEIDNLDETDSCTHVRYCNHHRMKKELDKLGLKIKISKNVDS